MRCGATIFSYLDIGDRVGLYETEVIRRRGPWKGVEDVGFPTLQWVAMYNSTHLLEPIGYVRVS
jgi:hypothetical protein